MNKADIIFKENIKRILEEGYIDENPRPKYKDGTPAHTKFITHVYETYDLTKNEFPISSLRPIKVDKAIAEILAFYQDQTNSIDVFKDKYNLHWWEDWDIGDKSIGQRYGATVKKYDIINNLIKGLKEDPFSRRHIIDLYQYADFQETEGLYPCAYNVTFNVYKRNGEYYLDCLLNQRSSDFLVAAHLNKMQYVALQMMLAHECGYKIGKFSHMVACLHIYDRHFEQANELLSRVPEQQTPILKLNAEGKGFYDIMVRDFELIDYKPVKPQLKFPLGI